jgi:Na+/phosphate symporter
MAKEKISDEQAAIMAPIIEMLLTMMRAARDAFNRHSRDRLQELQNLQAAVTQNISTASRQVQSLISRKPEAEQKVLWRLDTILSRLGTIDANLGGLADPINKKIQGAVLFSDKAVAQTNYLFDQHAGMIRSLLDIVKTDNQFLKNYVGNEGRNLVQACADYATEHQDRLIEGLCTPQAAPIFLAILDAMRGVGQTEVEIAKLMAGKP